MEERDLSRMQRKLAEAMCNASDNGGVELLEAASYSTANLARILNQCGERKAPSEERRHSAELAQPRGSRCLCPACAADYRLMAALG